MNILFKNTLAALVLVFSGLTTNATATCYYAYGDKTTDAAEALRWAQQGRHVETGSCNITPPMIPPRNNQSQQSHPYHGGHRAQAHPACNRRDPFPLYDSHGRLVACSSDPNAPLPGSQIPQYRTVQHQAPPQQWQGGRQQQSGGGILSSTLDGIATGYAAQGNSQGVRDGAAAGAARGLVRAIFGQ